MLTISVVPETSRNRFECRTCPYQHVIEETIYQRRENPRRERDDVLGGPGAWDNAQKEKVDCTREGCEGKEAAFFQVQIRSADEPMTTFFKVCAAFASCCRVEVLRHACGSANHLRLSFSA